jgi:hypothetical protein
LGKYKTAYKFGIVILVFIIFSQHVLADVLSFQYERSGGQPSEQPTSTPSKPELFIWLDPPIIFKGQSSNISWEAFYVSSCIASGGWSGSKQISGKEIISPTTNTTYNLTCTGPRGNISKSVTLIVKELLPLKASCFGHPNPALINETVTFSSSVSGGTGSYQFYWSGDCVGTASSCKNAFSTVVSKIAILQVISGDQLITTSCSVEVVEREWEKRLFPEIFFEWWILKPPEDFLHDLRHGILDMKNLINATPRLKIGSNVTVNEISIDVKTIKVEA